MAARWAFVCALITSFGLGSASAERRPVAVVNLDLSDASAAKALADKLVGALFVHPDLSSLANPTDAAALKDPIEDPDRVALAVARDNLLRAEEELVAFNYGQAESYAEDGVRALLSVTPSAARQLSADLMFVRGQAFLFDGNRNEGLVHFALSARLDPNRTLDPARHLPSVVATFAAAKSTPGAPGSITVNGTGRVWIDGIEVGQAPGGFAVAEGRHLVWLAGADRNVRGERALVVANNPTSVTIPDAPISQARLVQRARIALARSADATARSAAMTNLAKLVGVGDAVLLHVSGDKVVVQTWHTGSDIVPLGFSSLREHTTEKPDAILEALAPPKPTEKIDPPDPVKPIVVKKWYQKRPYQLGIAAGVVAAIAGIYFVSQIGPDGSQSWGGPIGVEDPLTVRK